MKVRFLLLFALLAVLRLNAEQPLAWKNSGFEAAFQHWSNANKLAQVTEEAAHSGKAGLRIEDRDSTGSSVSSSAFAVKPGVTYCLRYWANNRVHGENVYVYFRYFDKDGKTLKPAVGGNEEFFSMSTGGGWKPYVCCSQAPEHAAQLRIWIHSLDAKKGKADFDDFQLSALSATEAMSITSTRVNAKAFPALDIRRIRAISQMLPQSPQGIGAPADDRAAWQPILDNQKFASGILKQAEAVLQEQIPDTSDELYLEFQQNGNRSHYESVHFRKRQMMNTLVLAECIENKGRFLDKLVEVIESILKERSWVLPAHDRQLTNFHGTRLYADLFCSSMAAELAQAMWMLQERLPAELRARIRREIMRRALMPYRHALRQGTADSGFHWMTANNNWNAVCTRNMVVASQILLPDAMERAEFVAAAEASMRYFVTGFSPDGYCSEGVGYWGYGFGHFMDMNEILLMETDGKLNFLEQHPQFTKVCEYAKNILLDNKLIPCYADSGSGEPSYETLELIQRHKPETLRKRVSPRLPRHSLVAFALHAFGKPMADVTQAPEKPVLEARSYFNHAGVLLCRLDVPKLGHFCAAIKGGHNGELHNHNDVGSYVISVGGVPLVIDPGNEVYTRRTFSARRYESKVLNSYGHDVPMVAGKLQSTGKKRHAEIIGENFSEAKDVWKIDMTSCYEVPELVKLTRCFEFDRETPSVTVTDEVEFRKPQPFESAIITKSKHQIVDDSHVELGEKGKRLKVEIQTEGGVAKLEAEKIENPGRVEPTRLGIKFQEPVKRGKITVKYFPGKK